MVGAEGFEPPTLCSQSRCASQTALCPDTFEKKSLDNVFSRVEIKTKVKIFLTGSLSGFLLLRFVDLYLDLERTLKPESAWAVHTAQSSSNLLFIFKKPDLVALCTILIALLTGLIRVV